MHEFPISYIAILNGTFFFRSVKAMNNWKRSAIKQILLLLLGSDRPSGLLFLFVPAVLLSILTPLFLPSSVSLLYFILALPIRQCLG